MIPRVSRTLTVLLIDFRSVWSTIRLEVLLRRCDNTTSEHWTLNFHVNLVEWAHDCLDPMLVNLREEQSDCFFGLWGRGIGGNGCRGSRGHDANWL